MTTNNTPAGTAATEGLRASDAEREQTVRTLRDNYERGRIGYDEFNKRIDAAYHATHAHQLGGLVADLPHGQPTHAVAPAPPRQPERRTSGWRIAAIVGLVIFAWAGLSSITAHPMLLVTVFAIIGLVILVKRNRRTGG